MEETLRRYFSTTGCGLTLDFARDRWDCLVWEVSITAICGERRRSDRIPTFVTADGGAEWVLITHRRNPLVIHLWVRGGGAISGGSRRNANPFLFGVGSFNAGPCTLLPCGYPDEERGSSQDPPGALSPSVGCLLLQSHHITRAAYRHSLAVTR